MKRLKIFLFSVCFLVHVQNFVLSSDSGANFTNNHLTNFDSNFTHELDLQNEKVLQSGVNFSQEITANDMENSKILAQREILRQASSKINNEDDVQLFLPPDISVIIKAMNNLEDKICKEHVLQTIHGLNNKEKWAMQMLDSSAKFPSGVLSGSYYQLGNFDECISVRLHEKGQEVPSIKGQYCLAEVQSNDFVERKVPKKTSRYDENATLHWAICVPHSCKPKDISLILDFILNGAIGSSNSVSVNVSENMCHYEHNVPYTIEELVYGYIIIAFVSIICIATFYHILLYYNKKDGKMPSGILTQSILSFSVVENVSKLFSVGKSDLNLNCICGIKFLSMLLIITSHSLLFLIPGPVINNEFSTKAMQKVENAIFLNNPLLVDTYLLISGFLMCRLVLLELEKRRGKVNFAVLYIFRYIRLTPLYFVIIGFYCTWFYRLDHGPLWDSKIADERDRCVNSWWANVLYVNNYINVDQMCMFQSWYLAVDTQLFMLAPLIVYPLWKYKKIGEILLGLSIFTTILIPSIVTFIYKYDATFLMFVPEIHNILTNFYFKNAYIKTHMRANAYCLGLFFGYMVHKIQSSDYKIPRLRIVLGWIFSCLFMVAPVFSVSIFYNPDYEYNPLDAAAYSTLHRAIWCLGVGWILVACITGNGGPVQKFLCWKPFIPLSRLTYGAYLVNGIIELHSYSTARQARYLSVYHIACDCLAHLLLTFALAFVLCIIFESPINAVEKILLKREKKVNQNQNTNEA